MKTLLFISVLLFSQSDFCAGWSAGYRDGYCFEETPDLCVAPVPPPCEIPEIGREGFKGGYQQGFVRGLEDYQNDNN